MRLSSLHWMGSIRCVSSDLAACYLLTVGFILNMGFGENRMLESEASESYGSSSLQN